MAKSLYTVYKGVYVVSSVHTPESLKYFEEFAFRPDDIIIVTYPSKAKGHLCDEEPQRCVHHRLFHHDESASFLVDPGPQTQFLHKFLDGKVMFGSWFDHVKSWLNAADEEHIMHISYEQMVMDLKDSVCSMAQFLQKPLDHEAIEKIADRCLFKNMKKNNMSNNSTVPREILDQTKSEFLRKGECH
ncbi:hypothetical protein KUCAC02_009621 [Chaenocephalus aceratus]|nr:hypothetical protein KUCAC02_009621 [Chaenocephalus aceratus]